MGISKAGESGTTRRNRLCKAIVLSISELLQQKKPDNKCKDLVAFIILALHSIGETVEQAVVAWEKRDYWLKADKFRMEWSWTNMYAEQLHELLNKGDWHNIVQSVIVIAKNLNKYTVSEKHRLGQPWTGAWAQLNIKKP